MVLTGGQIILIIVFSPLIVSIFIFLKRYYFTIDKNRLKKRTGRRDLKEDIENMPKQVHESAYEAVLKFQGGGGTLK